MKLLIEIPDNYKKLLDEGYTSDNIIFALQDAVVEGTPLPKHHGRLLILDEERVRAYSMKVGDWSCQKWINEVGISNSVVTIIPATKEGDAE